MGSPEVRNLRSFPPGQRATPSARALLALFLLAGIWPESAHAQERIREVAESKRGEVKAPTKAAPKQSKPSSRKKRLVFQPLASSRQALVPFKSAPFPYTGLVPVTGKPFLDVQIEGRYGRFSARTGQVYWADETYNDARVLLDLPQGFNAGRAGVLIVFLHGNGATLARDVIQRQHVPKQIAAARLNSALIAPQLAVDALDSSAGKFWEPGAFAAFLDEATTQLARLLGDARAKLPLDAMPVVVVAYSGGYLPLAYLLQHGGATERIIGVVVLDGLYGEPERFAAWIDARRDAYFVGAYGRSSSDGTTELARLLGERNVPFSTTLGQALEPGDIVLFQVPDTVVHADFVTKAWTDQPLRDLLRRMQAFPRQSKP